MKECEECECNGYTYQICGKCSGSGEGMHDGTRCRNCGGSGFYYVECDECEGKGVIIKEES